MAFSQTKKKLFRVGTILEAELFLHCQNSPWHFINGFVKTLTTAKGYVPFKLYQYQNDMLWYFLNKKYCITLKPRQMGISVLICAYALWLAMFNDNKKILIISIKLGVAVSMLKKIKEMYRHLPEFLKVEILNGDGDKNIGTTTLIHFANGSTIEVSPATEDAGRSESLSLLILDEVAFQQQGASIWGAAQPTLSTGGQAILCSTAFGIGNFFHETWTGATQGLNGFTPIKLDWKMHPDRTQAWYDAESKVLGAKRTAQEIDCDFLKSGYMVFDAAKIRAIEDRMADTPLVGEFENGFFKQYERPQAHKKYFMGADVATGKSRDFSALSIMDEHGKGVANWKGKLGVRPFGELMAKWGQQYNMAELGPEVNAIGEGVVATLQGLNYPHIYNHVSMAKRLGEYQNGESLVAGWLTTGKTRNETITGLDDDLNDELIEINNHYFTQEAWTFIYDSSNKPIALGKGLSKTKSTEMYGDESTSTYTDDMIIAECITNSMRKANRMFRGALPFGS